MKNDEIIRMRVSREQKKVINDLASAAGLSMTAYILYKVGEAAGDKIGKQILQSARQKRHTPRERQLKMSDYE